jgi:hypothetical protein
LTGLHKMSVCIKKRVVASLQYSLDSYKFVLLFNLQTASHFALLANWVGVGVTSVFWLIL